MLAITAREDLARIDDQSAAAFERISKIPLSGYALTQLSLQTSHGGLGIQVPTGMAAVFFAASGYAA